MHTRSALTVILAASFVACQPSDAPISVSVDQYATVRLTADVSSLSDNQRKMLELLIEASEEMDAIYWQQAYGNRDSLLASLEGATREYAEINYGPWDRLAGNEPFLDGEFLSGRHYQGGNGCGCSRGRIDSPKPVHRGRAQPGRRVIRRPVLLGVRRTYTPGGGEVGRSGHAG